MKWGSWYSRKCKVPEGSEYVGDSLLSLFVHLDIWDEFTNEKKGMLVLLRTGLSEREVHSRDFLHFCVSLLAILNLSLSV